MLGYKQWSCVMKKPMVVSCVVALASILFVGTAKAKTYHWKASWYQCCSSKTASGYPFRASDPHIVAHKSLPFGTRLLLSYKGRSLCGVVRDRGPFVRGKTLDLTRAGAEHLGFKHQGIATLVVVQGGC